MAASPKRSRAGLRHVPGLALDGGGFDRLVHEPLRLGIVSALSVNERLAFTELREMTGATDGNLSVHARKLEEAGYIACEKSFEGRTPRTEFRLTAAGRKALQNYLDHMQALIRATKRGRRGRD
jgi:DNA-binding MarR family transcriptional regulator